MAFEIPDLLTSKEVADILGVTAEHFGGPTLKVVVQSMRKVRHFETFKTCDKPAQMRRQLSDRAQFSRTLALRRFAGR